MTGPVATPRRKVARSVRQAQHPERDPVAVTCRRCGHQWESWASDRSTIRCPDCQLAFRLHRTRPATPAPVQSRPATVRSSQHVVSSQVTVLPRRETPSPADDVPEHSGQLTPLPDAPDPADDTAFASKVYDAITRTVYGRRPQQITSSLAVIAEATRIVKGIQRTDEPSLRWKVTLVPGGKQRLELWSDPGDDRLGEGVVAVVTPEGIQEIPPPVVVPFIADAIQEFKPKLAAAARSIRSGKRGKVRSCDYCGAIPPYTTPALYKVESPAMNAPRILCTVHATSELSIPDATAVPA